MTLDAKIEAQAPKTSADRPAGVDIDENDNKVILSTREQKTTQNSLPAISIDSINYAQANFDRMDGDRDGFVSVSELDGFAKANRGRLSDTESKIVDDLKAHMDPLQNASNDEFGRENSGFTRMDLSTSRANAAAATADQQIQYDSDGADLRKALDYVNSNFSSIDTDHNGLASQNELNIFMASDDRTAAEIRMTRNVRDNAERIKEGNVDGDPLNNLAGISQSDLQASNEKINNLTFGVENFNDLDANGDGFVNAHEVEVYERARNDLSAAELQRLESVKGSIGKFEENYNDEFGRESRGFTGYDLMAGLNNLGSANAHGQYQFGDSSRANEAPADVKPAEPAPPEAAASAANQKETPEEADQARYHSVRQNESLWKICRDDLRQRNGSEPSNRDIAESVNNLAAANNLDVNQYIHPGQRLRMPDWTVQPNSARSAEPAHIAPGEPDQNGHHSSHTEQGQDTHGNGRQNGGGRSHGDQEDDLRDDDGRGSGHGNDGRIDERQQAKTWQPSDALRENMIAIDQNGDNNVSKKEIENYLNEYGSMLNQREIDALDKYARNADKIANMVDDGFPALGISMRDLDKLDQMSAASKFMLSNSNYFRANHNGDRFLKKDEIIDSLRRDELLPEERVNLNYLLDNYNKFEGGTNDETGPENSGITQADLRYFANLG